MAERVGSTSEPAVEGDVGDSPPFPAAEVLIDLKESAKRRRMVKLRTSPRKRTPNLTYSDSSPKKTPLSRHSSRRLNFSNDSSGYQNSVTESSDENDSDGCVLEEEPRGDACAKRPKRMAQFNGTSNQIVEALLPRTPRSDQVTLHIVSSRLRNLLKLPKAHKWCYYEWFYSDIDQPLLVRENDFSRCLSDMFPELKSRLLTRVQWRLLRRMMGKPRRCSPTFFAEERNLMEYRRNKVRLLQQQVHQGLITVDNFKDLPDEIPALLVLGTHVTARLHSERERESGFYTGKIEAVEFRNNKYWVTFDRPGIGKHLINDTEIKSADPPEFISISSLESSHTSQWPPEDHIITSSIPPLHTTPPRPLMSDNPVIHALLSPDSKRDPFLTSSPAARRKMLHDPPGMQTLLSSSIEDLPEEIGGFPVPFLRQVTQLSKLLRLKQQRLNKLHQYNTDIEKMQARQRVVTSESQHKYAKIVIDLDDINRQLNIRLESIKSYCDSLGYGTDLGPSMDVHQHAGKITQSSNSSLESAGSEVKDPKVLQLITQLTGLLLQIEGLSESGNSLDLASLTTSLADMEARVQPQNRKCFQSHVESPVTLIQSGMSPVGPLHAFSMGHTNSRTFSHQGHH